MWVYRRPTQKDLGWSSKDQNLWGLAMDPLRRGDQTEWSLLCRKEQDQARDKKCLRDIQVNGI